jgi:predicted RNA binding protein YcfA (HicA-like mRNA interferase family)
MSTRLAPVSWTRLRRVFERDGFTFKKRTGGSHWVGEKPGVARPIVIPEYAEVGIDIIQANMRTAGMDRKRFLRLLAEC